MQKFLLSLKLIFRVWSSIFLLTLQQAITAISLTGRKDCQRFLSFGLREAMDTNEILLDCLNFAT